MDLPKLKFIYAYPLDINRRSLFADKDLGYYPSVKEIKEKINHWETLWNQINENDKIILKLKELTKKVPERSLECFVFGGGMYPMSIPFLMPITSGHGMRSDEEFVDVMTHEILHIFIADVKKYFDMVRNKYSGEHISTQNHIIIYAFLEKICLEMFNSKPIDFSATDLPNGYSRAIEIVKKEGYEKIITDYHLSL